MYMWYAHRHMFLYVCGCMCIMACIYGGPRLMSGIILNCFSSSFIETGSLSQTQSSWILLVLLVSSWCGFVCGASVNVSLYELWSCWCRRPCFLGVPCPLWLFYHFSLLFCKHFLRPDFGGRVDLMETPLLRLTVPGLSLSAQWS